MAKQPDTNFSVLKVLQDCQILKADASQEQAKKFLIVPSLISYSVQSLLAIFCGWWLTYLGAYSGFTRRHVGMSDDYAPFLLQGEGFYINVLITVALILCQLVYLVLRVRFNKELSFKIGRYFGVLVAFASLSIWLILDYYSKVTDLQTYTLHVKSPRDFALIWIVVGTLTMFGVETNSMNTRTRDYELELEISNGKIEALLETGIQPHSEKTVEFAFQFRPSRASKAITQLEKRDYSITIQEKSLFKTRLLATKILRLDEIVSEIKPMMGIALANKGYYLSFAADGTQSNS
jgi:hypothetical protein